MVCLHMKYTAATHQRSEKSTGNVREVPNGQQKSYGQVGRKKAILSPCGHKSVLNRCPSVSSH